MPSGGVHPISFAPSFLSFGELAGLLKGRRSPDRRPEWHPIFTRRAFSMECAPFGQKQAANSARLMTELSTTSCGPKSVDGVPYAPGFGHRPLLCQRIEHRQASDQAIRPFLMDGDDEHAQQEKQLSRSSKATAPNFQFASMRAKNAFCPRSSSERSARNTAPRPAARPAARAAFRTRSAISSLSRHFAKSRRGSLWRPRRSGRQRPLDGIHRRRICGFHKFPDSHSSKSRTLISVIPGQ